MDNQSNYTPSSRKSSPVHSLSRRYSLSDQDPGFSSSLVLKLPFEATDLPSLHSQLTQFTYIRPGETQPRQVLLPLFFEEKQIPSNNGDAQNFKKKRSSGATYSTIGNSIVEKQPKEEELKIFTTISTQGNHEIIEEVPELFSERERFEYERELIASGLIISFQNEGPAHCASCGEDVHYEVVERPKISKYLEYLFCRCFGSSESLRCSKCKCQLSV